MSAYDLLRRRHVALVRDLLPRHVQRLRWSAAQLAIERRARLRDLLRVALSSSPWHRDRLAGLDPDRFEEEDLARLPPMTKNDLMAHWDDIVTDRRLTREIVERHLAGLTSDSYLLDEVHAIASGGSTGTRGVYVFGWEPWALAYAGLLRMSLWDRAVTPGAASAPNTHGLVAAHHASHMSSAIAETFSTPEVDVQRFPISMPIDEVVRGLNRFQPDSLIAYASALGMLAFESRAGRLRIAPRRVTSTSEPLLPEMRRSVEDAFGVPVGNLYATSEAGPVAVGCWRGAGMHLCDDLVIVEPVDHAGRRVGAGVRSDKIYLTAICNPTLPLIRFEMTDQVELLDAACPCGSAHRLIADVEGRVDDVFEYQDGVLVHPHVFRSVLCRDRGIVEYQILQTARGATVLAVGSEPDSAGIERAIAGELRRLGVAGGDVTFRVVSQLERQPTGKMRRFVPLAHGTS
jgi:phenylacetate-coenzyme A ligase PaaK-like adenylate-forming protein